MSNRPFNIEPHTTIDKRFEITSTEDIRIIVDYDDVNHPEVDKIAKRIVAILNDNWHFHREGEKFIPNS